MIKSASGTDAAAEGARRYNMSATRGSHVTYVRAADLVVEWYDFGEHAPYESANLLIFGPAAQQAFALALGLQGVTGKEDLAETIADRFSGYFDVERFAELHAIAFERETDFEP